MYDEYDEPDEYGVHGSCSVRLLEALYTYDLVLGMMNGVF
jgi:hypothetical protein